MKRQEIHVRIEGPGGQITTAIDVDPDWRQPLPFRDVARLIEMVAHAVGARVTLMPGRIWDEPELPPAQGGE